DVFVEYEPMQILEEVVEPVVQDKQGAAKLVVTRQTVLEKKAVQAILFGLVNEVISQYSAKPRNGQREQKITRLPLKGSLEQISGLPLTEQAKLYFATHSRQFKSRASAINSMFGHTLLESLRNEVKWSLQASFRRATAAEKNQFRAALSDAERHDLGVRASKA
ncbi:MAG: hypothetical protein JSR46_09545, partial [Verrucomicrobia bacterium]|nr:hypothetical protein [Verrucomicrobiota bacterium]